MVGLKVRGPDGETVPASEQLSERLWLAAGVMADGCGLKAALR
jgi:hypothetical protein